MAESAPNRGHGLLESIARLAGSLAGVAHTHLDLLSSDIEKTRSQAVSLAVAAMVTLFCFATGMVLAVMLIVAAFWETHRLLVLALLSGFFLAAGIAAWLVAARKARAKPRVFATSLSELLKDRQRLASTPQENPHER